jgi:hypothetical protein
MYTLALIVIYLGISILEYYLIPIEVDLRYSITNIYKTN